MSFLNLLMPVLKTFIDTTLKLIDLLDDNKNILLACNTELGVDTLFKKRREHGKKTVY
jgi:hypothetical protein